MMAHRFTSIKVRGITVIAMLGLAACVTPQRKAASPEVPIATQQSAPAMASSTATRQKGPPVAPRVQASAEYRQYLENQLLCPAKSTLASQEARKRSFQAGLISGKGKESESAWGTSYQHTVIGDLSIFGFKVVALEFDGNQPNTGGLYADVEATPDVIAKFFKARRIPMQKINGGPGFMAKRPYEQFATYEKKGNLVRIGCFIPID